MKTRIDLSVEPREAGKGNSRKLRSEKKIPAVIYGAIENTNVFVNQNDVLRYNVRAYENALFNLKSSTSQANDKVVLMKNVDVHPLTRQPLHVDFFALDMNKTVRVNVEIKLEGKPAGLAEGGLLNVVNRQIEVEVLPSDIPESFTADISHLGVGDALHVSDLQIPENIRVISALELTIAVVNVQEEEAAAPEAAPVAAAAAAAPAAGTAATAAPAAGAAKK